MGNMPSCLKTVGIGDMLFQVWLARMLENIEYFLIGEIIKTKVDFHFGEFNLFELLLIEV